MATSSAKDVDDDAGPIGIDAVIGRTARGGQTARHERVATAEGRLRSCCKTLNSGRERRIDLFFSSFLHNSHDSRGIEVHPERKIIIVVIIIIITIEGWRVRARWPATASARTTGLPVPLEHRETL